MKSFSEKKSHLVNCTLTKRGDAMKYFQKGHYVITPLGELAQVIGVAADGRVDLCYEESLAERDAYVSLKPELLQRYIVGQPVPNPVRLKCW